VEKTVSKIELKNIINKSKYIFMKPHVMKTGLSFSFLIKETKKTFSITYNILSHQNVNLIIYWSIIMVLTF